MKPVWWEPVEAFGEAWVRGAIGRLSRVESNRRRRTHLSQQRRGLPGAPSPRSFRGGLIWNSSGAPLAGLRRSCHRTHIDDRGGIGHFRTPEQRRTCCRGTAPESPRIVQTHGKYETGAPTRPAVPSSADSGQFRAAALKRAETRGCPTRSADRTGRLREGARCHDRSGDSGLGPAT